MYKISLAHLYLNLFQKRMSRKLELKIFSNSILSAVNTCLHMSQLKLNNTGTKDTTDFPLKIITIRLMHVI